jgi:ABC-type glycerol-3-phosphate transport system permease component
VSDARLLPNYDQLAAAVLISVVPVVLVFLFSNDISLPEWEVQ